MHAIKGSREARRHARESRSYRKLAFVKSRSETKFKATFRLSHRESCFTAVLLVGRLKRSAAKGACEAKRRTSLRAFQKWAKQEHNLIKYRLVYSEKCYLCGSGFVEMLSAIYELTM